ncbi:MAG TPA: RHS repeat-associated core domain-containing protein [Gemmatales bacterium]|nr:RHS repeat-associated core domain-containing protein [Gemmatales bacterium]HMP58478.1 RHS repeat-associated core domain-containing protein [Gemmatales bacterium]
MEKRLYVAHDANFNVSSILNTSGSAVERYVLDPYGSPTFLNGSWSAIGTSAYAWSHLHQGGRQSAASSLCHFRHREFSPTLGRWMTNDPIGFHGWDLSLYRAFAGTPRSIRDPEGLLACQGQQVEAPQPFDPCKRIRDILEAYARAITLKQGIDAVQSVLRVRMVFRIATSTIWEPRNVGLPRPGEK